MQSLFACAGPRDRSCVLFYYCRRVFNILYNSLQKLHSINIALNCEILENNIVIVSPLKTNQTRDLLIFNFSVCKISPRPDSLATLNTHALHLTCIVREHDTCPPLMKFPPNVYFYYSPFPSCTRWLLSTMKTKTSAVILSLDCQQSLSNTLDDLTTKKIWKAASLKACENFYSLTSHILKASYQSHRCALKLRRMAKDRLRHEQTIEIERGFSWFKLTGYAIIEDYKNVKPSDAFIFGSHAWLIFRVSTMRHRPFDTIASRTLEKYRLYLQSIEWFKYFFLLHFIIKLWLTKI